MNLDDLCRGIVAEVNGCLGCAVVDLDTGLLVAMDVVPGSLLNPEAMEYLSVACVDYFRGRTIWQLELEMSGGAGVSRGGFVQEIQTTTSDMHHFMAVVPGWESTLFILVTDKTANLGLGWIAMRRALAQIAELHDRDEGRARRQNPGVEAPSTAPAAQLGGVDGGQGTGSPLATGASEGQGGAAEQPSAPPEIERPEVERAGQRGFRPVPAQGMPEIKVPSWRGGHGTRGRQSL